MTFEWQVQIVTSKSLYSFVKCTNQATHIKVLMLNNGMPVLCIIINSSDLQSPLVLIFTDIQYKLNSANISPEVFAKITAKINLVTMIYYFKIICHNIFEHLLATNFKNWELFGLIFTYFSIIKTNDLRILYLHCLV